MPFDALIRELGQNRVCGADATADVSREKIEHCPPSVMIDATALRKPMPPGIPPAAIAGKDAFEWKRQRHQTDGFQGAV